MGPGSPARKAVALLAVVLLAWLSAHSLREFRAELASLEADTVIRGWNEAGKAPSQADWTRTKQLLEQARDLTDGSAVFQERLGYWHSAELVSQAGVIISPDVAVQYFRAALVARPSSAYTWANLANAKYMAGQVDAEFYAALQQSARLGPWEPWIQAKVADLGLALWDEASPAIRIVTVASLERGILRDSPEMMKLLVKRGRLSQICALSLALGQSPACRSVQKIKVSSQFKPSRLV